ncbi:hypothetical protein ACTHPH_11110 [Paenibacillus pasadenensis]|uniref:Signal transduction histidine kinase n=1 Tax=Paenibacillus pasadenensis TaxID=217090 RepID=A0A2N5N4W1_9BACL|nr:MULTISPECIES: hypothetical protein [Paenibacillus]PLT45329.1 hypothetical protein B8V81_3760 [Paenibacillus pasadenensis]QGG55723.1 hypothetical protein GE073_09170 [Paenibacillus sp. B01]
MDTTNAVIFIIASFCLAAIVLMNRSSLPDRVRKPLAISAIALVSIAFVLLVASLFRMGT